MGKIIARDCALKLVYQNIFNKDADVSNFFDEFEIDATQEDQEYAIKLLNKVVENYTDLENEVSKYLKDFEISRVYKVDLSILLVAICEIKYFGVDCPLAINEAVELAKKYSTDKSPSFINGVLGSYVRNNESK